MTTNRIVGVTGVMAAALVLTGAGVIGARVARAAEGDFNACGCRQTPQGACICEKKSKCGCEGECEPKGCDERRAKQVEKEIQAETKKAEESSRRQNQERDTPARRAPSSDAEPAAPTAKTGSTTGPKGPKMTSAQKKELARLMGLYLAEHPDDGSKTVTAVRDDLTSGSK